MYILSISMGVARVASISQPRTRCPRNTRLYIVYHIYQEHQNVNEFPPTHLKYRGDVALLTSKAAAAAARDRFKCSTTDLFCVNV